MTSIVGKYQHYKNENVEDYFTAVGVPYVGRKMMAMSSPLMEISMGGNKMTMKSSSLMRTVENTFALNEDYDEKMPNATIKVQKAAHQVLQIGQNLLESELNALDIKLKLFGEIRQSKTTIINDNEMITSSTIPETGEKCARHYLFTDDECVVTLTHDKAATPGKRFFKRVK